MTDAPSLAAAFAAFAEEDDDNVSTASLLRKAVAKRLSEMSSTGDVDAEALCRGMSGANDGAAVEALREFAWAVVGPDWGRWLDTRVNAAGRPPKVEWTEAVVDHIDNAIDRGRKPSEAAYKLSEDLLNAAEKGGFEVDRVRCRIFGPKAPAGGLSVTPDALRRKWTRYKQEGGQKGRQ